MRDPDFWWQKPGLAASLLSPLAWLYGAIAARRMQRPGVRVGIPVICVGNFTLGGTGKTPTALAIARLLAARGETPFFLTRGYGGRLPGPLRVDPASHRAVDVGDEPLLLARQALTIVARDRAAGAAFARAAGASVIVMDDGLQNPSLHKDLAIAVIDGRRGLGNGRVFPAGPLRAPLATQLSRVQAILVVGESASAAPLATLAASQALPLLRARLTPSPEAVAIIGGKRALAFAGIGDPQKFFATLADAGIDAPVRQGFADHHPFTEADAAAILERCETEKLVPVTTEKDLARLTGLDGARGRLAETATAIPVTLVAEQPDALPALLTAAVSR